MGENKRKWWRGFGMCPNDYLLSRNIIWNSCFFEMDMY